MLFFGEKGTQREDLDDCVHFSLDFNQKNVVDDNNELNLNHAGRTQQETEEFLEIETPIIEKDNQNFSKVGEIV